MKISVVIPVHNVAPWVEEALQSVIRQTHAPDEIFVVDDASTDETVSRVRSVGSRAKVLSVDCRNAATARNLGAQAATGTHIAFLDGDDRWRAEHLERFVQINRGKDVGHFSHHDGFDEGTGVFEGRRPLQPQSQAGISDEALMSYFVGKNHGWPTSGMIVRRDRFEAVGGFDQTQVRRHDAEMFLRLVHGATWSYEASATWEYRLARPGNISGVDLECAEYMLRALLKIQRLYGDARLEPMMKQQSQKLLSLAVKSGVVQERAEAFRLALTHVGQPRRAFYMGARISPRAAATFLRLKSAVRRAMS